MLPPGYPPASVGIPGVPPPGLLPDSSRSSTGFGLPQPGLQAWTELATGQHIPGPPASGPAAGNPLGGPPMTLMVDAIGIKAAAKKRKILSLTWTWTILNQLRLMM